MYLLVVTESYTGSEVCQYYARMEHQLTFFFVSSQTQERCRSCWVQCVVSCIENILTVHVHEPPFPPPPPEILIYM